METTTLDVNVMVNHIVIVSATGTCDKIAMLRTGGQRVSPVSLYGSKVAFTQSLDPVVEPRRHDNLDLHRWEQLRWAGLCHVTFTRVLPEEIEPSVMFRGRVCIRQAQKHEFSFTPSHTHTHTTVSSFCSSVKPATSSLPLLNSLILKQFQTLQYIAIYDGILGPY